MDATILGNHSCNRSDKGIYKQAMTHIPGHLPSTPYIPENPFGAFQATFGTPPIYPSTGSVWGDIKAAPGVDFIPGLSTAANWEEMGPWGRSFSLGLDTIDLLTMGLGKFGTAPVRSLLPKATGAFNRFISPPHIPPRPDFFTNLGLKGTAENPIRLTDIPVGARKFVLPKKEWKNPYVNSPEQSAFIEEFNHPPMKQSPPPPKYTPTQPPVDTYGEMARMADLAAEGRIAKNVEAVSPSPLTYDILTGTRSEGVSPGQMLGGYGEAMGEIYGTTPIFPFSTPSGIIPLSAGAPFERRILDAFEGVSSSPRYGSETFSVPANPFSYSPKLPFLDITKGFMGAQDVVPQDIRKLPNMSIAYPPQQTARSSADIVRQLKEEVAAYTAGLVSRGGASGIDDLVPEVENFYKLLAEYNRINVKPLKPWRGPTQWPDWSPPWSLPFTIPARGVLNYDPRNDVRLPFRGGADTGG
jgi:hypothetical protein